jgi:hypothetical protein
VRFAAASLAGVLWPYSMTSFRPVLADFLSMVVQLDVATNLENSLKISQDIV